jgi:hypothetical protein
MEKRQIEAVNQCFHYEWKDLILEFDGIISSMLHDGAPSSTVKAALELWSAKVAERFDNISLLEAVEEISNNKFGTES